MEAAAWLLRQGYYVFRSVSTTGPVDLIAMKNYAAVEWMPQGYPKEVRTPGELDEILLIDVKSNQASPTADQVALGVSTMYKDKAGDYRLNAGATFEARKRAALNKEYLENRDKRYRYVPRASID